MHTDIKEHMEVVGSCGNAVGRVDHVEGNQIKLTKDSDPHGKGHHHYLPMAQVKGVEGGKVVLTMNSEDAKRALKAQPGA